MKKIREVRKFESSEIRKFINKHLFRNSDNESRSHEERGIALIMTLGILSMLLVLALAFASNARTERKAANANANLMSARLLAESAIERLLAVNQMDSIANPATESELVITRSQGVDPSDGTTVYKDFLSRLSTTINKESIYAYNASDDTAWEFFTDDEGKIIGRVAYVSIGGSSNINPAAVVKHNGAPGVPDITVAASTAALTAVNEKTIFLGSKERRPGLFPYEINIINLNTAAVNLPTFSSNMSSTNASPAGFLTDGSFWPNDWDSFFTKTGIGIATDPDKTKARKWFSLGGNTTPEAYWIDKDNDGIEEPNEIFHRFNMMRYTDNDSNNYFNAGDTNGWDSVTVNDIIATPTVWEDTAPTHNGTGIPWIANWQDDGATNGNFADAATRGKQIAANLIDYCDSDSTSTTDNASWSDDTITPTYTGNDLTPYINELGMQIEAVVATSSVAIVGPPADTRWDYDYTINLKIGGEIVNMYGTNFSNNAVLYIKGSIQYDVTDPTGTWVGDTTENFTFVDDSITFSNPGTTGFVFLWSSNPSPVLGISTTKSKLVGTDAAADGKASCRVKVKIDKAYITYNGVNADYANVDAAYSAQETIFAGKGNMALPEKGFFNWQIEDPRHNLHAADWPPSAFALAAYGGTPNATNCNPATLAIGGTKDLENTTSQATLSTAFIRNAPMKSPWEIGAIHRGEKWETINLKAYDSNALVKDAEGGAIYADGDAHILDQVKFTKNVSTLGKIYLNNLGDNAKATNDNATDIFSALLTNIYLKNTDKYLAPGDQTGTSINSATAQTITRQDSSPGVAGTVDEGIVSYREDSITATYAAPYNTAYNERYISIAQLANVPYIKNSIAAANDAEQEELLGKFINLTTVKGSTPGTKYIIIAQAIKDIGGTSADLNLSKDLNVDGQLQDTATDTYDADGDGNTTETIDEKEVGTRLGRYDSMFDEILSEQKILVELYFDDTVGVKKWKIVRIEYLED